MSNHHHHALPRDDSGGGVRLGLSIAFNLIITIAEVVGGLISGSLALLSDALHNFSDTSSLVIAYVARRYAQRAPDRLKTFGYKRAEIIGAFVNLITLVLIALFLIKEGITRLLDPQPIDGPVMLVVAVIGLLANVGTALLLRRDAKHSLNVESAFLHIITDAVSSVGVVLGGLLIMWYDVYLVDPILTLAISVPTLAGEALDHVIDMHHLHVWQLDDEHAALEAHITIEKGDLEQMEEIKEAIKRLLDERFHIAHSTLEFEFVPCDQPSDDPPCFEKETAA